MSEYTDFLAVLTQNLMPFQVPYAAEWADLLTAHARIDQLLNELHAEHGSSLRTRYVRLLSDQSIKGLVGMLGLAVELSRNPAECPIRLLFPDGTNNSIRGGYCVPLRRDE
jgi:hypothetical protein